MTRFSRVFYIPSYADHGHVSTRNTFSNPIKIPPDESAAVETGRMDVIYGLVINIPQLVGFLGLGAFQLL